MRDYYDSAGNRTGIAYPNGASTSYAYDNDPRYRLIGITDSGANMTALQINFGVSVFRELVPETNRPHVERG